MDKENLDEILVDKTLTTVLVHMFPDEIVFKPKWRHDDFWGDVLTLKEIYEQVEKAIPAHLTIMVIAESALHGEIYLCGNYKQGEWVKHGTTMGYA